LILLVVSFYFIPSLLLPTRFSHCPTCKHDHYTECSKNLFNLSEKLKILVFVIFRFFNRRHCTPAK
jgi:hypothetical protein